MKKFIFTFSIFFIVLSTGVVFSDDMNGMMNGGPKDEMMDKDKMCPVMMKMGMMHGMMGNTSMVASNDGGVIVMLDNKLYKYDKNLNLVKEVELKTDMMMKDKGKMCPMRKMMHDDKMKEDHQDQTENEKDK